MEEKERYELIGYCSYRDTETGVIGDNFVELLNQQGKRINELEDLVIEYKNKLYRRLDQVDNLIKENNQLKQQLKDTEESYNNTMRYLNKTRSELLNLPKKIVEEIRKTLNGNDVEIQDNIYLTDMLDTIVKKYGGENESK